MHLQEKALLLKKGIRVLMLLTWYWSLVCIGLVVGMAIGDGWMTKHNGSSSSNSGGGSSNFAAAGYAKTLSAVQALQEQAQQQVQQEFERRFKNLFQQLEASGPSQGQRPVVLPPSSFKDIQAQGVDLVYLWVNGSDPRHQKSLQQYAAAAKHDGTHAVSERLTSKARWNGDREEMRYSLRSVQWCMPWFRHLYIVTASGQLPSWLDISNPRVTIVPDSTIMRPEELPTFNSNALEANLHKIPGLSDAFIYMNDDFFLTKPWVLRDFITEDGHEVMYDAGLAPTCRPQQQCSKVESAFTEALMFVDRLFLRYNNHTRSVPAHSMYFYQKSIMRQLQDQFPDQFRATTAHRFRSSTDMQVSAAYKWFVQAHQPNHTHAHIFASGFVMLRDHHSVKREAYGLLMRAFAVPATKVVCMNDNTSGKPEHLDRIDRQVLTFMNHMYPQPSEFELPPGVRNGCGYVESVYGQLPSQQDVAAACSGFHGGASVIA